MPVRPSRPPALVRRVFRGSHAVRAGLLTPDQLRSSAWRRLHRDAYADADLPVDHGLYVRAAALVIPPSAVVTGRSAAWLWGARLAGPTDPVDVAASPAHRFGPAARLRIRRTRIPADQIAMASGVRVTLPLGTAWEIAQREPLVEAVVLLDALAALDRISRPELAGYLASRPGRGRGIATRAFALIDGRAESPQESRLRVRLAQAGLPTPIPQYVVTVRGGFVARLDLAWPDEKVAAEYDGRWHAEAGQFRRDRRRLNALLAAGWVVHHVTAHDMYDLAPTVAALTRLLARRRSTAELPG